MASKNGNIRYATIALTVILTAVVCVSLFELGQRYIEIHYGLAESVKISQGAGTADTLAANPDFDPLNDTLTQWVMALCALLACATSIWGIVILRETLEQSRAASVAATLATEAAIESNAIMRADQRPWISLSITPLKLEYMPHSDTLMVTVAVNLKNKGKSPAIDLAMDGSVKIISKGEKNGLSSDDYVDLRRKVTAEAVEQTQRRSSFTEVIFPDEDSAIAEFGIHAHLKQFSAISQTEDIALVAAFALAYGYGNQHGGAVWSAIIFPLASRKIFGFTIESIKNDPSIVQSISTAPVAYF